MATMEELRLMLTKATPAPWAVRKEEYDSHEAMTADTGKTYARGGHVLHYLAVDGTFPAFTGNGPTSKVNAEYLAAAHDAMPALLRAHEALTRIAESVPCRGDHGGDCAYCGGVAAMDDLSKHDDDCPWKIARVAVDQAQRP